MLLKREKTTAVRAVERLAGLQAQLARPPFIGLWSRLQSFQPAHLTRPVHARKIVRATLMRGTLHLVTTKDYRALRPLFQPMLTASLQAILGERACGLDLDGLTAKAPSCLDERPQTFEELRAALRAVPFAPLSRKTRAELVEEGEALVGFVEPDARTADVRFG
jgi:hypothetical protein